MSGGTKHDHEKPKIGLISTIFIQGLAAVLTFGARKYSSHNWRKGIELSRVYDALQRHLWSFWSGEDLDAETGLSHLDHASCELMFLRELWETRKELDDRYRYEMVEPITSPGYVRVYKKSPDTEAVRCQCGSVYSVSVDSVDPSQQFVCGECDKK